MAREYTGRLRGWQGAGSLRVPGSLCYTARDVNQVRICYEVTAIVRPDLVDAYEKYIPGHMADVLATGCFDDAAIFRSAPGHYCICYTTASQTVLDQYLSEHAPRLRADLLAHFPTGIELSRATWTEWLRVTP
jgi:Domain of unknown function (DUF4286)